MIREDRFLISRRPYAVDLNSIEMSTVEPYTHSPLQSKRYHRVTIDAVWFRRKNGVTAANIGTLRYSTDDPKPADALEALARHDDGRYGGDCQGRWDGERYWGAQEPETIERHLEILRPMLENFPNVPAGYDGWWTFAKENRA